MRWIPRVCALAVALLALSPCAARAEEEMDETSRKVMEQMEKIIRLMRENEQALLTVSAGGQARPRPVEVEPPAPAEAAPSLEELVRGQRQTSERIPRELEELVRMVPQ